MKTADLITSYLNNEMTPEQERQFLLSVAASDSLRLSLKSHVMLDKIVTNQIQRAHVPESVRESIFTEMRSSVGGSAPVGAAAASGAEVAETAGFSAVGRLLNNAAWRFGRGALVGLLVVGGFAAGYLTRSEIVPAATPATVSAPVEDRAVSGVPAAPTPAPVVESPSSSQEEGAAIAPANTDAEREADRVNAQPMASNRDARIRSGAQTLRRGDGSPVGAGERHRADEQSVGTSIAMQPDAAKVRRDTIARAKTSNATVSVSIERPDQEETPANNQGGTPDQ